MYPGTPLDPGEASRRLAIRLDEAGLPSYVATEHDQELELLKVTWAHGVTLYMDLIHDDFRLPIDAYEREVILGLRPCCEECAKLNTCDGHASMGTT